MLEHTHIYHTHTPHIHTRARAHTHIHTIHAYSTVEAQTHTHTFSYKCVSIHIHSHACTHTQTHAYTCLYTCMDACIHTRPLTPPHTHPSTTHTLVHKQQPNTLLSMDSSPRYSKPHNGIATAGKTARWAVWNSPWATKALWIAESESVACSLNGPTPSFVRLYSGEFVVTFELLSFYFAKNILHISLFRSGEGKRSYFVDGVWFSVVGVKALLMSRILTIWRLTQTWQTQPQFLFKPQLFIFFFFVSFCSLFMFVGVFFPLFLL